MKSARASIAAAARPRWASKHRPASAASALSRDPRRSQEKVDLWEVGTLQSSSAINEAWVGGRGATPQDSLVWPSACIGGDIGSARACSEDLPRPCTLPAPEGCGRAIPFQNRAYNTIYALYITVYAHTDREVQEKVGTEPGGINGQGQIPDATAQRAPTFPLCAAPNSCGFLRMNCCYRDGNA